MSANDTIREALDKAQQSRDEDKTVIVCLCGMHVVEKGTKHCPGCGKKIVNEK